MISALVLAPVGLACVWLGGAWFDGLIAVATLGTAWEWARLSRSRALACAAGLVYVAFAAAGLVWLRSDLLAGRGNLFFLLALVWSSDIGAYAAGRVVGGRKLAPAISPGKTWSGAAGGLASAVIVGLVAGGTAKAALVAAALGVVSQAGDLAESAMKRRFGVKDSGTLIPGHGGLLDRLDGLLAVAGAATVMAVLIGRGVWLWQ